MSASRTVKSRYESRAEDAHHSSSGSLVQVLWPAGIARVEVRRDKDLVHMVSEAMSELYSAVLIVNFDIKG